MDTSIPGKLNHRFAWLLILHSASTLVGSESPAANQIINPFGHTEETLRALAQKQQAQIETAKGWKTFHDFSFTDRLAESGIGFVQHPVDDAAKNYKAVHYDHGTGIAVADVD